MKLLKSENYIDYDSFDLASDELKFICQCLKRYKSMSDSLYRSRVTSLFVSKKQINEIFTDNLKIDSLVSKISCFLGK